MIYVCPVHTSLKMEEFLHYKRLISESFKEISVMGSLGCKSWGEVMLTHYEEQGVKTATRALNEIMSYDDNDLDVLHVLERLSNGGTEEMLVAIEVARALQPEKKLDRKLRPILSEEFDVLPDITPSLNPNELVKKSEPNVEKSKKIINSIL